MRTAGLSGDDSLVRFIIELVNDPEAGLFGSVEPEGQPPIEFSGWLSLIRLLEDRMQEAGSGSTISPDGAE